MTAQAEEPLHPPSDWRSRLEQDPHAFLLETVGTDGWQDGTAIFGGAAVATLEIDAAGRAICRHAGGVDSPEGDPFHLLDAFCGKWLPARGEGDGRAVLVALNYDLRHVVEPVLRPASRPGGGPLLVAAAYEKTLSWPARRPLVASSSPLVFPLSSAPAPRADLPGTDPGRKRLVVGPDRQRHEAAIRRALGWIAAGDIYQVNLAQPFVVEGPVEPLALFEALQSDNPMPFAACARFGDFTLVSNSPECLLEWRGGTVATWPIKGTRPRGRDAATDRQLTAALQADPKEQAEHLMIVDLERNDLGRVCEPGSVRVEGFASLRTYPRLHHLVSRVEGRSRPATSLATLLRALFPGGSVTGAPKIRAMQVIDELEPMPRGFYTGALGLVRSGDRATFSLTIRTATLTPGRAEYWAGGGIVADSDPGREYEESLLKAQPFLRALGLA